MLYWHIPGATHSLEEQLADMIAWKNHLFEQWCMVEQERDEARAQRDQNFDVLNAAMNERNELVDDYNGLVDHIEVLQDQMQQLVEQN